MANVEGLGLAPDRERYNISQHRTIEVRVGIVQPDIPGSPIDAWFHCLTCDDIMYFEEERQLFECHCCGYTVSRTEAVELCHVHVERIRELASTISLPPPLKKKKRWYFLWLW